MKSNHFSWSLSMDPDQIKLETMSKMFAYEQQARLIEECNDIDELQNICKSYAKLYFKQQEVVSAIGLPS